MEDLIMKKTLLFIAAAVMFVLAGCQKDQYIQESKKNDIIHINVGQIAPATRVAAVDIDAAKLSFKFEEGDEVAFVNASTMGITEFTCTNPATGEFEKTDGDALDPDGEYLVVYPVFAPDYLFISGGVYPQNYRANQIPKEHVIISNGGDPVSGASTEFNLDYHFGIIHFQLKGNAKIGSIEYQSKDGEGEYDEVSTILSCGEGVQLSDTPTHFYMDVISTTRYGFKLIFKDASGNELGKKEANYNLYDAEGKMVDFATPLTVNAAAPTTTGTAKRTGDIDVNWVQLWDGGPKFAEYNVGASSVTETGTTMTFTEATKAGAEYVWGANWCTPSKEDMDELLKAATGAGSTKVECVYTSEGGTNGFKFTGKETGYTSNSVFFPAQDGDRGTADYWSATANGSEAWSMHLGYAFFHWGSRWDSPDRDYYYLVRPVFKETPATTGTAEVNESAGITGNKVNWVQLWEGGPKFAEYNIGATSATDYGGYYTWGGTYANGEGIDWLDDHNTDTEILAGTYDTATALWGDKWRMPTQTELQGLIDKCEVEWTTVGGVYGRKFTGKTEPYSSNSVFLPAAGCCYKNSDGDIEHDSGSNGYYWSSTPNGSNGAYFLYFDSGFQIVADNLRYVGSSVRAVLAKD